MLSHCRNLELKFTTTISDFPGFSHSANCPGPENWIDKRFKIAGDYLIPGIHSFIE